MRPVVALGSLVAALFMVLAMAAPVQAQDVPQALMCLGKPATLIGSAQGETLLGTAGNDVIVGLGGNDIIRGLGGNDLICGGPGNDRVFGGAGADRLDGGGGSDVIQGGNGNDWIHGRTGNDALYGAGGSDRIFGNGGADKLWGGLGIDFLNGDAGVDQVTGGPGNDLCRTQAADTRISCPRPLPTNAKRVAPAINNTFNNSKFTLGPGFYYGGTEALVYAIGFETDVNAAYTGKDRGSMVFRDENVCDFNNLNRAALTPGRYTVRFTAPSFVALDAVWHLARGYVYCAVIEQVN